MLLSAEYADNHYSDSIENNFKFPEEKKIKIHKSLLNRKQYSLEKSIYVRI